MGVFDKLLQTINGKEDEFDEEVATPQARPSHKVEYANDNIMAPVSESEVSLSSSTSLDLKVAKPVDYTDVKEIANYLKAGHTVLLNLESAEKDPSRRILDFLAGVTFTIGGTLKPVARKTYIISPPNVNVSDAPTNKYATPTDTVSMGLGGGSGETLYNLTRN